MQYVYRFNVMPRKAGALRDWLKQNDQLLREEQPEGWHYLGTWFTVRFFGKYNCEMRFELDDYDALGAGFGSDAFQRAFNEMFELVVPNEQEAYLMKSSDEVSILNIT